MEIRIPGTDVAVRGVRPLRWVLVEVGVKLHLPDGLKEEDVERTIHLHRELGDVNQLCIDAGSVTLETLRLLAVHLPVLELRGLTLSGMLGRHAVWGDVMAACVNIISACTTVQSLTVYTGSSFVVNALKAHKNLTRITFCMVPSYNCTAHIQLIDEITTRHLGVRYLDIRGVHLDDLGTAALVRLLESGHCLEHLQLSCCWATPEQAQCIVRALRRNTALVRISLPRNGAYGTERWPQSVVDTVRATLAANVTLRVVFPRMTGVKGLLIRNAGLRDTRASRFTNAALVMLGLKRFRKTPLMTYVAPQLIKFVVHLLKGMRFDPAWDEPLPGIVTGKRQRVATKRMNLK